ncbi:MAG: aldo/keto reductase [Chitinophagaceae bacterium]|nr:aldo/keto reductase [Chitinophagaceae bacterium]
MNTTFVPLIHKSFSSPGLGCVTFGREIDRQTAFALMDYAVENGITFFDTAAAYGDGASEKIIGEWKTDRRPYSDAILIATKILPPYNAGSIEESVNRSLQRLRTDAIDVLYLHRWDAAVEDVAVLGIFNELISAGKIRMLGASNFNAAQLTGAIQLQENNGFDVFTTIQNNNNFAVRDINSQILELCLDHDIKIVTYSPLGAGFLTGKYQKGVEEGTRFSLIKGHQDIYFNDASFQRLNQLQDISARTGYAVPHLALAWALHQPHITSVLIGGRSTEQLQQAFSALDFYDPDVFKA